MRDVDLAFVTIFWPTGFLILGMEINPCIASGGRFDLCLKVEVLEWFIFADVEEVTSFPFTDETAIFHFPARGRIFIDLPTVHGLAIEEDFPMHLSTMDLRFVQNFRWQVQATWIRQIEFSWHSLT